jgi:hypothetical protein
MLGKLRGNDIPSFLASLITVEHDGDEAKRWAVPEECHLLVAERRAHQGHRRQPQTMQAHRPEVAFDDDQVLAVIDPREVPELERLVKSLGQFVLSFSLGKLRVGADPAAGIGHELALSILDRDADASGHGTVPTEPKAEELAELGTDLALCEVGMLGIERKPEPEWLVALGLGLALGCRFLTLRATLSVVVAARR